MITIDERPEGCIFSVRVQPRARRDEIVGESDGAFKIRLTAPPADGEANRSLIALLSRAMGVPKSRISILRGETSRRKTISILGVNAQYVLGRLGSKP